MMRLRAPKARHSTTKLARRRGWREWLWPGAAGGTAAAVLVAVTLWSSFSPSLTTTHSPTKSPTTVTGGHGKDRDHRDVCEPAAPAPVGAREPNTGVTPHIVAVPSCHHDSSSRAHSRPVGGPLDRADASGSYRLRRGEHDPKSASAGPAVLVQ